VSQTSRSAATGPSDTVALRNLEIRTLPNARKRHKPNCTVSIAAKY